jgi:hypothetical protein
MPTRPHPCHSVSHLLPGPLGEEDRRRGDEPLGRRGGADDEPARRRREGAGFERGAGVEEQEGRGRHRGGWRLDVARGAGGKWEREAGRRLIWVRRGSPAGWWCGQSDSDRGWLVVAAAAAAAWRDGWVFGPWTLPARVSSNEHSLINVV